MGRLPPHALPGVERRRTRHRVGPRPAPLPLHGRPRARLPRRAPRGAPQRGHRGGGRRASATRCRRHRAAPQPRRPGATSRLLLLSLRVPRRRAIGNRSPRARLHPQGARTPRHALRRDCHGGGRRERRLRVDPPRPRARRLRRGPRAEGTPSRAGLHPRVGGRLRGVHALRDPPSHGAAGAPRGPRRRGRRPGLLRRRRLRAPRGRRDRRHRRAPRVRRIRVRAVHAAGGRPRGAHGREGGAAGVWADAAALLRHQRASHGRRQRPWRGRVGNGRARGGRGPGGEVRRDVRGGGRRDRHGQARGGRTRRGHERQGARGAHRAQHRQGEEGAGRHDVRHLRDHGAHDDGGRDAAHDGALPAAADRDHSGERWGRAQRRRRMPGLAQRASAYNQESYTSMYYTICPYFTYGVRLKKRYITYGVEMDVSVFASNFASYAHALVQLQATIFRTKRGQATTL